MLPTPPAWLIAGQRPVMMAIGDSFLNGMRSVTIHDDLAKKSIPAEVGRCLRVPQGFAPFTPAEYPPGRPVLIDAEAVVHHHGPLGLGSAVAAIPGSVRSNALAWLADQDGAPVPSNPRRFDNLAIAGARLPDVFGVTYRQLSERWAAMRTAILEEHNPFDWKGTLPFGDPYGDDRAFNGQPGPANDLEERGNSWDVSDVHITLNARHLMNPDGAPGLEDFTVLNVVRARRPLVLLVHLGANHGLPDICVAGRGPRGAARLRRFAKLWPKCAEAIADVDGLELCVVVVPPLPSQVPALMPPQQADGIEKPVPLPPAPNGRRYHPTYVSALTTQPPGAFFSADEVRGFDAAAAEAWDALRRETQAIFDAKRKRVRFVNSEELIGAHDVKNAMGTPFIEPVTGARYDNRCIGLVAPFKLRGGICSLDNFHPTTLGYRVVARAVAQAIADARPELVDHLPEAVQQGDTLLENPPWLAINALQLLWPLAQSLPGGGVHATDAGSLEGLSAQNSREAIRALLRIGGLR